MEERFETVMMKSYEGLFGYVIGSMQLKVKRAAAASILMMGDYIRYLLKVFVRELIH